MRPKGIAAELQSRRLQAGQLLMKGNVVDAVAELWRKEASRRYLPNHILAASLV